MRTKLVLIFGILLLGACSSAPSSTEDTAANEDNGHYTGDVKGERAPAYYNETVGAGNSADYGYSGDTEWSSRNRDRKPYRRPYARDHRFPSSGQCNPAAAAEWIKKLGAPTTSSHSCLSAVRAAYGGCGARRIEAIHSYGRGIDSMRKAGFHCETIHDPFQAPEGAIIVENNHVEIRVGRCFYSDFHVVNCKPGTQYSPHGKGNPRHMFGWCTP